MPRVTNPPNPKYARKRKATTTMQSETKIARIAKQVVLRNQETKHFTYQNVSTSTGSSPRTWNVIYHGAARGTTENTFIGEKFYMKGISAKISGTNNNGVGNSSPYYQGIGVYAMIVACRDYNSVTNLGTNQFCDSAYSNVANRHFIDSNKCKVLAKGSAKAVSNFSQGAGIGQLQHWEIDLYAKVEKQVKFLNFGSDWQLSGWNYYVIVWGDQGITSSECPTEVAFKVYFKDA